MGVDIGLFISPKWRIEEIQDTLESLYGKVVYSASFTPDMTIFHFNYSAEEQRDMYVHINTETGGFTGHHLRLSASYGHSKEIMEAIAKRLGGFLNYEDVNENYVAFQTCGQWDIDFLVRRAITHGETDGSDIKDFANKAIAYSDKLEADRKQRHAEFFANLPKRKKKV